MELRFFRKDEKNIIQKFIDEHWSKNHIYVRNADVLDHLVLNTPYREVFSGKNNYSVLGVWDKGEVAGMYGFMPQKFNVAGYETDSFSGTIWKVDKENHPDVNGLDFYNYLFANYPSVECGVLLGISDTAYMIYSILDDMMTIDNFPRWIAVNDKNKVSSVLLPKETDKELLPEIKKAELDCQFNVEVDKLDAVKWDSFYKKKFAPISIGTKRDYEFLQWRYIQSPLLKYHIITLEKDGEYHGMAVIRIESIIDGQYTIGRILEFIAVESKASVMLANEIIKYDTNVLMWDFYCLSDITAFGLETVGFRKIPAWMDQVMMPTRFQPVDYNGLIIQGALHINKKINDRIRSLPNSAGWYITRGDADQDRAN